VKLLNHILIVFTCLQLNAQVDNTFLYTNVYDDTIPENTAFVKLQGLGFMKNIENFGPMQDGFTLFGYQFNPQIGFQMSPEFSLEGGVYLQKDFGNPKFNSIAPTFSLRYQKKDFKMIFGTLDGSLNHRLIEPMYGFDRFMTNRLENGAQFILTKKYFDFDIWIDWQNMLYRLVDDYERFWLGISANAFKYKKNKFSFQIPLQATARHNGGQIARGGFIGKDREGVYTNLNYSAGLFVQHDIDHKYLESIYADGRLVVNENRSNDSTIYKKWSNGAMANIGCRLFGADVMLSYWYGSHYTSEFGGDTYWSASSSVTYAGTYKSYRNVLLLRITKTFKLAEQAYLTLRAEPLYDIDFNRFHYSYGFYLNFDKRIALRKKN